MPHDSIHKSVTVPLHPDAAFDLFTNRMDTWWPVATHSLSARDGALPKSVHVAPHIGGPITETQSDGTIAQWGSVSHWEPGRRFGMRWHVGRSETEATDVMVTFTPVDTGTRVDLVHSGFAALGAQASAVRTQYDSGWDHVLGQCYVRGAVQIYPAHSAS